MLIEGKKFAPEHLGRVLVLGLGKSGHAALDYLLPLLGTRVDALAVAALVEERFPALNGKVEIYPIGTTIGSHTGPGTVALFFWGINRPIEEE